MNIINASQNSIEGVPFITRFKTIKNKYYTKFLISIEGIPFITRFKTLTPHELLYNGPLGIEGIPFITRFKTPLTFRLSGPKRKY